MLPLYYAANFPQHSLFVRVFHGYYYAPIAPILSRVYHGPRLNYDKHSISEKVKDYPANGVFSHMSDKKKPLKTKGCRTIFTKTHFFVAIANRFAIVRLSPVTNQLPKIMKTLSHNQEVRIAGFKNASQIRIFTIAGYAIQNGENPDEAIARSKGFGHDVNPCCLQSASVLSADYIGKKEELDAKDAATAASPEIANGELVEIEGCQFITRVLGQQYSDPVKFVKA